MSTHRKRVWVIQNLAPLHGLFFKDFVLARPLGGDIVSVLCLSTLPTPSSVLPGTQGCLSVGAPLPEPGFSSVCS